MGAVALDSNTAITSQGQPKHKGDIPFPLSFERKYSLSRWSVYGWLREKDRRTVFE